MSDTTYKSKVGYKPPVELEYHKRCLVVLEADLFHELKASYGKTPKRGEWIENRTEIVCSKCHARFSDEIIFMNRNMENEALKYCPNCGAKMEVPDGV